MAFLFWLLWAVDLLFFVFVLLAAGFRGEMNLSTGLHGWLLLGLVLALIGGPVLRFLFRLRLASLVAVALPLVGLLVAWLVDKSRGV